MIPRKSIVTKLWIYMTVLTVVALLISGLVLSNIFEDFYFNMRKNEMINEGQQLISLILGGINPSELLDISKFINAYSVIIDRQGLIQASSNVLKFEGVAIGPKELREVLNGNIVVSKSFVSQFDANMLTVALPIRTEGNVIGGVILFSPMSSIESTIWQIRYLVLSVAGASVLVLTALSLVLSKTISKPLIQMKKVAEEIARGEFGTKVKVKSQDEVGTLANAINYMSEALNKNINMLDQEKRQLQNILLSMTDGVITFDAENRVIMANPQAVEMIPDLKQNGELKVPKIIEPIVKKAMKCSEFISEELEIDGKVVAVKMTPLLSDDGVLQGVLAVLQDITRERKQEDLRKEFLSDVSHELRTPLTYLQGYTEALIDGIVKDSDEHDRYLNIILEETLRLRRLVDELLELSHMEAGHLNIQKDYVSIKELVEQVCKKFLPICEEKNINLKIEIENIQPILIDEDKIEQVMINLIDNAIRYSPSGQDVLIKAGADETGVTISVRDSGSGIPDSELPFIWERFYKVDKSRARKDSGTGLGLAIAKRIIELHNGKIWAKNCAEGGTEFSFFIPWTHN